MGFAISLIEFLLLSALALGIKASSLSLLTVFKAGLASIKGFFKKS